MEEWNGSLAEIFRDLTISSPPHIIKKLNGCSDQHVRRIAMYVQIVVYRDGKREFCVPIPESGASIGRDAGNAVQLPLPEISKKHAFLKRTPKGWHIKDLGSRNGLYVNGIKAPEAVLQEGSKLRIGPYTLLVIEIDETALLSKPVMNIDFSDEAEQPTIPPQGIKKHTRATSIPTKPDSPHKTSRS